LARTLFDAGRYAHCVEHAQKATSAFDELGDELSAGRAVAAWARALALSGEPSLAIELSQGRFDALRGRDEAARPALELAQALISAKIGIGLDVRETLDLWMTLSERLKDGEEPLDSLVRLN